MKPKSNYVTEIHLIPFRQKLVTVKYLAHAFYEQLLEEEIIDSVTGSLLGTPLGCFNNHDNNCPTTSHFHILWIKGDASLRISIRYDDWRKRDPRYRKERAKRITHRNELGDLLALLLAPSHHYDSKSSCVNDNPEVLELSGPLYVSTGAGQNPRNEWNTPFDNLIKIRRSGRDRRISGMWRMRGPKMGETLRGTDVRHWTFNDAFPN